MCVCTCVSKFLSVLSAHSVGTEFSLQRLNMSGGSERTHHTVAFVFSVNPCDKLKRKKNNVKIFLAAEDPLSSLSVCESP